MKKILTLFVILFAICELSGETYIREVKGFTGTPISNGVLSFDDFSLSMQPARPILPVKNSLLLLKPFAKRIKVRVIKADYTTYKLDNIRIALPPASGKINLYKWKTEKKVFLHTNAFYPENIVVLNGDGYYRKYRYVSLSIFPMQYNPVTHELRVYKNIEYEVTFDTPVSYSDKEKTLLNDNVGKDRAKLLFDNWNDFSDFYTPSENTKALCDLLILTTPSLKSLMDTLVNWKQSIGVSSKVVAIDSIIANVSGTDTPEKIRNFLISTYPSSQWGYKWLLIVGDVDSIPMRKLFPDSTNHATSGSGDDYNPPSDFYYAELTGNFDADGDGYFGEYGQDSTEFIPEIAVGRIPYDYSTIVFNVLTRMFDFEGNTDINYKQNFIFMGAISNYANEDNNGYSRTDGGALGEDLLQNVLGGWNYYRMNEQSGIHPSTYTCEAALNKTNVTNIWNSNSFGLATWWAHGSATGAFRKYWSSDDGDSIPESGEMTWTTFIDTGSAKNIYNYPSVLFSCSCNNAWVGNSNNLIRTLLRWTSISVVGANRVSWYTIGWNTHTDGGNASIDYHFLEGIVSSNYNIGDALNYSLAKYYNNYFWWGWQSAQNIYDFNLYGDPSLFYFGKTQGIPVKSIRSNRYTSLDIQRKYTKFGMVLSIAGNRSDKILNLVDVSGRRCNSIRGIYNGRNTKYFIRNADFEKSGVYFASITGNGARPIKLFVIK